MKYKIKNLGKSKINELVDVRDHYDLHDRIKAHLLGDDIIMVENRNNTGWNIFSGTKMVGEATGFKEIKNENSGRVQNRNC